MPATWSPATPRDWVAGELVTATHMNDEVRNRMMYLKASPAFDGNPTVAGTLAVTGAGTFSSTLTAASNMGIAAAAKLYLDGVAMSGNTYLHEQSADQVELFVGGSRGLVVYAGAVECGTTRDLIVAAAKKVYLDGGANTYLHESSADTIGIVAGGTTQLTLTATAATVAGTLGVTGAGTFSSTLAAGNTTITGTASVSGLATLGSLSIGAGPLLSVDDSVGTFSSITSHLTSGLALVRSNGSYAGNAVRTQISRAASSAFNFILCDANSVDQFKVRGDAVVQVGGSASRATTDGAKRIDLFDGTAPVGTLTNGVSLYSSGGKLFAMDAAGTATQLTP